MLASEGVGFLKGLLDRSFFYSEIEVETFV